MSGTHPELREEMRENWGTRTGFVLAAVGSAVGLGNLWGFPYKLYAYGGGAFLIPYLLALVVVGIPMMILEFSLGHYSQRAAPDAFRSANRRFEMVGWWGIILGFVIITYYPVILAYCFSFLGFSVKGIIQGGQLPWAGEGIEGVQNAKQFFFGQYLSYEEGFHLGGLRMNIVAPLVLTWVSMYLCIFKGVRFVGKIVWLTVPIPWIMLLLLAVRGLTLPGAGEGLAFYLNPDWKELAEPSTWRFAFGQVFFSMSLAFGVMITYASFLHRKSDLNNNAAIIGLADLATSFVAGLAVFATLGAMAAATRVAGHPVPVESVVDKGPGLAFVAFPYALAQLPYSAWFSLVFFLALITLGIDSAFSITESILAAVVDKTGWRRGVVLPVMSIVGLASGLIYVTNGGLNWLDVVDSFINGTWGIAFMGLVECLVLGWLYKVDRLRHHANERSDWQLGRWWNYLIRIVIPIVLAALVTWNLFDDLTRKEGFIRGVDGHPLWPNIAGLAIVCLAPILAFVIGRKRHVDRDETPLRTQPSQLDARQMISPALAGSGSLVVLVAFVVILSISRGAMTAPQRFLQCLLALGAGLSVVAVGISQWHLERENPRKRRISWGVRWGGAIGCIDVGASIGLLLGGEGTVWGTREAAASVQEAAGTSVAGAAYVVLSVIMLLLVLGLSWCFYRAIKAAK